jgi:hypothetical protein
MINTPKRGRKKKLSGKTRKTSPVGTKFQISPAMNTEISRQTIFQFDFRGLSLENGEKKDSSERNLAISQRFLAKLPLLNYPITYQSTPSDTRRT